MVGGLPNSRLWNIDYEELVFKEQIGKGNFGNVYRGSYLGAEVAIKQIPEFDDPDYAKYTEREVKALRYIRHPHVVHFFGACQHTSGFYLITEYVPGNDLRYHLKSCVRPPRWSVRVEWALSVAETCLFLHAKNILHRDLKTKNVLLDASRTRTKLCDFGFARVSSQYSSGDDSSSSDEDEADKAGADADGDIPYTRNGNGGAASHRLRRMSICGTPSFMAPEILLQRAYDWSADVFSFGVIMAELITLKRPGKDFWVRSQATGFDISVEELNAHIPVPNDCPTLFYELCLRCCAYSPESRPLFSDIVHILSSLRDTIIGSTDSDQSAQYITPTADEPVANIYPITLFKERKRQSIGTALATQGVLKLSTSANWKEFGIESYAKVWIIYQSNIIRVISQLVEMSPAKVVKISKNSLSVLVSDPKIVNGTAILNVKPYVDGFPHVQVLSNADMRRSTSALPGTSLCVLASDLEFWRDNGALVIRMQALARRWLARSRYNRFRTHWRGSTLEARHGWLALVDQLIASEHEYRRQLDHVLKSYLTPLQSKFRINKPLINYKEIAAIFSNIESISELHNILLTTLAKFGRLAPLYTHAGAKSLHASSDPTTSGHDTIARFFVGHASQIKTVYGKYMYNFKYAMNTLGWCRLNPDFAAFTDAASSGDLDLAALLAVPINRIQKYQMLFEGLSKQTPSTHPEHREIGAAFSLIREVSAYLQNQLEMSVNYSNIMSIETMLMTKTSPSDKDSKDRALMQSGRWFVRQGALEDASTKQRYFLFLVSDMCLVTKPVKSKCVTAGDGTSNTKYYYREKYCVSLKDSDVSMRAAPDSTSTIVLTVSPSKSYRFTATSDDEAAEWILDFERTAIILKTTMSSGSVAPSSSGNGDGVQQPQPQQLSGPSGHRMSFDNGNFDPMAGMSQGSEGGKNFIRRFRQTISAGSGSPDRRESSAQLTPSKEINHPPSTPPNNNVLMGPPSTPPTDKKRFSTGISDFGGYSDHGGPETAFDTAAREFSEETMGLFCLDRELAGRKEGVAHTIEKMKQILGGGRKLYENGYVCKLINPGNRYQMYIAPTAKWISSKMFMRALDENDKRPFHQRIRCVEKHNVWWITLAELTSFVTDTKPFLFDGREERMFRQFVRTIDQKEFREFLLQLSKIDTLILKEQIDLLWRIDK
eukprot:gene3691-4252_t